MSTRWPDLAERGRKYLSEHKSLQSIPYWMGALLAGLAAVAYAKAFKWASDQASSLLASHPTVLFVCAPILFVGGWALVRYLAPEAAGSGIPQAMAANELDHRTDTPAINSLLGIRTAAVKVASSLLCVLGGGAIGREGPTIQISAALFHFVGTKFQRVWPKISHHAWIIAGGAAGIASAFNTPLGGIVFAVEELATEHFTQFRTLLISAVIIAGLVAQSISGPYLYLGYPVVSSVSVSFMPWVLLVGVIAGLAGGAFGKLLFFLVKKRSAITSPLRLGTLAAVCGLAMVAMGYFHGTHSMGPGNDLMSALLFQGERAGFVQSALRFFGTMVSYLSGCAGGIFAPSLAAGASIGSQLSRFVAPENANLVVLLGMIGFLTGVTRAPFTAFVLVLEMTDHHGVIFPMMLSAIIAYGASRIIERHSFYEAMKHVYLQKFGHGEEKVRKILQG